MRFFEGNCKMALNRMVMKYTLKMTLSLLKSKKELENNKLKNVKRDAEDLMTNLEGLKTEIELINKE